MLNFMNWQRRNSCSFGDLKRLGSRIIWVCIHTLKIFVNFMRVKRSTYGYILFLEVMLFTLDHQLFDPVFWLPNSCLTALNWFSRINLLIFSCNRVFASVFPFCMALFLWFKRWFTRGDMNGGSRDDDLTLINGKLISNFGHIIS
jgi:hypothetical protein